jgi:hypothetical protein
MALSDYRTIYGVGTLLKVCQALPPELAEELLYVLSCYLQNNYNKQHWFQKVVDQLLTYREQWTCSSEKDEMTLAKYAAASQKQLVEAANEDGVVDTAKIGDNCLNFVVSDYCLRD